ncbi:hypothetical protein AB0M45_20040 [Nocardia sp. NPDC051787]|uniref:hypothetical protein n=1 Tax=Nocardia sp. NPDC051787 TaxID=3155415 RepID=UPI003427772C
MTSTDVKSATGRYPIPVLFLGFAALLLCLVLSLAAGARSIPVSTVVAALIEGGEGRDARVITGCSSPVV